MVLAAKHAEHGILKCEWTLNRTAESIPTWQRMKSNLQFGRVIILWGDAGFETFLETLKDFHDPFKH